MSRLAAYVAAKLSAAVDESCTEREPTGYEISQGGVSFASEFVDKASTLLMTPLEMWEKLSFKLISKLWQRVFQGHTAVDTVEVCTEWKNSLIPKATTIMIGAVSQAVLKLLSNPMQKVHGQKLMMTQSEL